jgi:hypothetical protein
VGIEWTAEAKAGALGIFDFHGIDVIQPAGLATIGYRHLAWFATLQVSQLAVPNVFVAAATISDQAIARLAIPLSSNERYYVMGYGAYNYGRLVDNAGTHYGFEQRNAGISLTARHERIPLWASLDYIFGSQLGNIGRGGSIPDLDRQAVMFTVGYVFSTDRESLPIFHGMLPAIPPLQQQNSEVLSRTPQAQGTTGVPGAPGWSGTPASPETPGAPGWSGATAPIANPVGSGNVNNVTR